VLSNDLATRSPTAEARPTAARLARGRPRARDQSRHRRTRGPRRRRVEGSAWLRLRFHVIARRAHLWLQTPDSDDISLWGRRRSSNAGVHL